MRRTWWVAALFLLPALLLARLVDAALSLERGPGSPLTWLGLLVLPAVGAAGTPRRAAARGFHAVAILSALFAALVYLRVWTDAGRQVITREGLDRIALGTLVLGGAALVVARRLSGPRPSGSRPAPAPGSPGATAG